MVVHEAETLLREARRILVMTGAGLSTESGVPDFRSPGGIWSRFDPDDFAYERFLHDPSGFWRLRAKLMDALDLDRVAPNPAHVALAGASRHERYLGHVTQNIDGLLQRAGHETGNLVEIHGSATRVRCIGCGAFFPHAVAQAAFARGALPPPCPDCAGPLKPGTILFGETLHEPDLERAFAWASHADLVHVVGSSLLVHPAARLPSIALARGARLVIVNQGPTPYDDEADALVQARAGEALPALLDAAGLIGR